MLESLSVRVIVSSRTIAALLIPIKSVFVIMVRPYPVSGLVLPGYQKLLDMLASSTFLWSYGERDTSSIELQVCCHMQSIMGKRLSIPKKTSRWSGQRVTSHGNET